MATPMLNCCSFKQGMYLPNGFDPPTDSCPPIIQYVADILDAVDGTLAGQLTVERYIDGDGNQHIHLYEWDGAVWVEKIETSFRIVGGLIETMDVGVADPPYQISVDGGIIWDTQSVTFDPPVATVDTWFRNNATGCIYSNIPQIPLAIYCVESYLADTSDPLFFFGLINGVDAGDSGAVLASYANFNGNATAIPSINFSPNPAVVSIIRDSSTPAFPNLGVYTPAGGPPTVDWSPTIVNCTRNCYQAVFTATDLATEGLTAISALSGSDVYDWGTIVPFSDPTAAAQNLAGLIAGSFLEPTATLTYSFNGLEVTVNICTVKDMYQFSWGTDMADIGTVNFTLI